MEFRWDRFAGVRTARRWYAPALMLAVLAMLALCLAPAAEAAAPTISILSPAASTTVRGVVTIEATATAAPGDHPDYISFSDGADSISDGYCEEQQTCTTSIKWEATGLSGSHKLSATVHTDGGETATAAIEVTVVSPPPTVTITSPASKSTVEGTVSIAVSAETDPSQNDYPTEISVYDGVNSLGEFGCQGQRTCQGDVSWPATGLSGDHVLTATVSTDQNLRVTSAPLSVTVLSPPPSVRITAPASGSSLGRTIVVKVFGETNPSQDEYPSTLKLYDGSQEIGESGCQGQRTCSASFRWSTSGLHGVHALTAEIYTSREISAASPRVYVGGTPARPHAHLSCRIASLHVRRGHRDDGSCTLPGAPTGTAVSLEYRVPGGRWRPVTSGHVQPSGRYLFFIRSHSRTTIELSVVLAANSRYAATRDYLGTLHVT